MMSTALLPVRRRSYGERTRSFDRITSGTVRPSGEVVSVVTATSSDRAWIAYTKSITSW